MVLILCSCDWDKAVFAAEGEDVKSVLWMSRQVYSEMLMSPDIFVHTRFS
jgi:hypothetical protein